MAQNADTKTHPQDSPEHMGAGEQQTAAKHQPPAGVEHVEPEDPRLVGGSKPEQHQALEDNVQGQAQQHPDTTGGLHATGSYAEDPAKKK